MPNTKQRIYWDTDVVLSFMDGVSHRLPILDALLDRASDKEEIKILTSVLSVTKVAYAQIERRQKALDSDVEKKIDDFWADRKAITLVDFHELIARDARGLIRLAIPQGWSLKPADAIHLATAGRMKVAEFHTYDNKLHKYSSIMGFHIGEPTTPQARLIP